MYIITLYTHYVYRSFPVAQTVVLALAMPRSWVRKARRFHACLWQLSLSVIRSIITPHDNQCQKHYIKLQSTW